MTDTDLRDEFADEEVWFRKDGTVIIRLDTTRYVLRRPKFKELRGIREKAQELDNARAEMLDPFDAQIKTLIGGLQDKIAEVTQRNAGKLTASDVLAAGGTTEELIAAKEYEHTLQGELTPLIDELRTIQQSEEHQTVASARRVASDTATEMGLQFFLGSIMALATPSPNGLEAIDLPTWCGSAAFIADLYDHWSQVPRRPGVA